MKLRISWAFGSRNGRFGLMLFFHVLWPLSGRLRISGRARWQRSRAGRARRNRNAVRIAVRQGARDLEVRQEVLGANSRTHVVRQDGGRTCLFGNRWRRLVRGSAHLAGIPIINRRDRYGWHDADGCGIGGGHGRLDRFESRNGGADRDGSRSYGGNRLRLPKTQPRCTDDDQVRLAVRRVQIAKRAHDRPLPGASLCAFRGDP